MPVAGDLTLDLSASGDFKSADLSIDAGHGKISSAVARQRTRRDRQRTPQARIRRRHAQDRAGVLDRHLGQQPRDARRRHDTRAAGQGRRRDLALRAQWPRRRACRRRNSGVAGIKLEGLTANGRAVPDDGLVELTRFSLKAGGSEFSANGKITSAGGTPSTRIEATTTPMALATLKALWPRAASPAARTWVGNHFTRGTVRSASLKILSGKFLEQAPGAAAVERRWRPRLARGRDRRCADGAAAERPAASRLSARRSGSKTRRWKSPCRMPSLFPRRRARCRSKVGVSPSSLRSSTIPSASLAFRSQTTLAALADVLNQSKLNLLGSEPLPIEDGVDGKVDGQVKITMPLVEGGSATARTDAKARITEIRGKPPGGRIELSGGSIDLDVSPIGVNASGQLIVNGVTAKIALQRIFDAPPTMQPPVRLTAVLDNADRTQLKLDVNHPDPGEMPIEITVGPGPTGSSSSMRAPI